MFQPDLTEDRIRKDNPHFIGSHRVVKKYSMGGSHLTDIFSMAEIKHQWHDGETRVEVRRAKATYEWLPDKKQHVLIAN